MFKFRKTDFVVQKYANGTGKIDFRKDFPYAEIENKKLRVKKKILKKNGNTFKMNKKKDIWNF